ncbi:MAG: MBOAT family protein, partial [Paludibacter sp.]|jgi:D-alanyl-lipoteichoic acid acyltransferase DltB (MBOAT superfamily)|nr:MBOAT family protein [Paludibacter sp.]
MFFNSLTFAIFLSIVFLLYWLVFQRKMQLQNIFVVVASYVFYGWWDWRFLLLIIFTTLCSYASGLLTKKYATLPKNGISKAKFVLITNIVLNLAILGIFKYYNFFVESFVDLFAAFGANLQSKTLNIILPVGISFYTFQALSYSIDVYKKKIEPTRDLVAFSAYISFFPLLVAGPIERATNLLPQFLKPRSFDYQQATDGLRQILWGLFKKIVIADNCATYVNEVFNMYEFHTGSTLLLALIFFAFQLYGDFSGYSDIAIGVSRLFGINAMRNFNYPYFANSFADYWKRNHISLTTWFMDYVYYPMLGKSDKLRYWNLCMIFTFLLSGLWHGAAYTFILWGLYQGVFIVISTNIAKRRKKIEKKLHLKDNFLYQFVPMGITFAIVCVGLVFFRAPSISVAFNYLSIIFSKSLFATTFDLYYFGKLYEVLLIIFMLALEWFQRKQQHGLAAVGLLKNKYLRWLMYYVVAFLILEFTPNTQQAFIYFQF